MHHSDGDGFIDFGFCQVGTNTSAFTMQITTASAVNDKDNTIAYVVADNRMKTGMTFADIVRENQSPKSVARFTLSYLPRKSL